MRKLGFKELIQKGWRYYLIVAALSAPLLKAFSYATGWHFLIAPNGVPLNSVSMVANMCWLIGWQTVMIVPVLFFLTLFTLPFRRLYPDQPWVGWLFDIMMSLFGTAVIVQALHSPGAGGGTSWILAALLGWVFYQRWIPMWSDSMFEESLSPFVLLVFLLEAIAAITCYETSDGGRFMYAVPLREFGLARWIITIGGAAIYVACFSAFYKLVAQKNVFAGDV